MKNIIIALLLVASVAKAQTIIPVEQFSDYLHNYQTGPDKYFKDVNNQLDKFVGTWKYQDTPVNPSKILYVTFFKTVSQNSSMCQNDELSATYRYYENGVEIYNTENEDYPLIYGGMFPNSQDVLEYRLIYDEPTLASKSLKYSFKIRRLMSDTPQLQWDVDVIAEVAENAALPRIPQHIVLAKQP